MVTNESLPEPRCGPRSGPGVRQRSRHHCVWIYSSVVPPTLAALIPFAARVCSRRHLIIERVQEAGGGTESNGAPGASGGSVARDSTEEITSRSLAPRSPPQTLRPSAPPPAPPNPPHLHRLPRTLHTSTCTSTGSPVRTCTYRTYPSEMSKKRFTPPDSRVKKTAFPGFSTMTTDDLARFSPECVE